MFTRTISVIPCDELAATEAGLFGMLSGGTVIRLYHDGREPLQIGTGLSEICSTNKGLFALDTTGNVLQYEGVDTSWKTIGSGMSRLIGGGNSLYGLDALQGNIHQYQSIASAWVEIGGPGHLFSAAGEHLSGITPDLIQVGMYCGDPGHWKHVGNSAKFIFAAPFGLCIIDFNDDTVWMYDAAKAALSQDPPGEAWAILGKNKSVIRASLLTLCAVSSDTSAVYAYSIPGASWTQIYQTESSIRSFEANDSGIYISDARGTHATTAQPEESNASSESYGESWIWSLRTSSVGKWSYDGGILLKCFWSDGSTCTEHILRTTRWRSGETYAEALPLPEHDKQLSLASVEITAKWNFWGDTCAFSSISALDPSDSCIYTLQCDADAVMVRDVANVLIVASAKSLSHIVVTAIAYVWKGPMGAVGSRHVTLLCADSTYISWWPQGVDRSIELLDLPEDFRGPAAIGRCYEDDVLAHGGSQPDWALPVFGLSADAIEEWWHRFQSSQVYDRGSQNAAKTCIDAILAGGAEKGLSPKELELVQSSRHSSAADVVAVVMTNNAQLVP